MPTDLKIPALALALLSAACADRKQAQPMMEEQPQRASSSSEESDEYLADPGSDPVAGTEDLFPLGDAGLTTTTQVDPATAGVVDSSTLAAGSINPGNNGASGSGFNNAAMMQGMMGMMTSMMNGQQPNPQALLGMFGAAAGGGSAAPQQGAGGLVGAMMPLLTQGFQ